MTVALESLLAADPDRDHRQAHGVDRRGDAFAHTGIACVPWCGHRPGEGFSVAGNMLTGPEVLAAMADAFTAQPERELAAGFTANLLEQYGDDGLLRYRQVKL